MNQEPTLTDRKSTCGMYVVGLIDLLNQGKQLDGWSSFPDTPSERAEFIEALKKTVGRVANIRKAFKGFVQNYPSKAERHPAHAHLTDAQRAEYRRLHDFELGCQNFSDTIVLYSPLAIPGGDTTVFGVWGMLLGTASVLMLALAAGVPLRGGIEVGMAIDHFPDEIYGPVLRRAYLLEQHVAQYPRVVVGKAAMDYLHACVEDAGETKADQFNRNMAQDCLSLIALDQDGAPFVDFLGDPVYQLYQDKEDYREQAEKGHEFAKREHERFVHAQNYKLALRYAWLRQYYESRIGRWIDSPAPSS